MNNFRLKVANQKNLFQKIDNIKISIYMYDTASSHTLAVFPLSAVSVKGFLSLSRLVSLLALRLKLAQVFQYALPFRRFCLLFLGGFLFFPDLPLPCGKVTIVLLHDSLRLAVGCHERLHIGITVLFQNILDCKWYSGLSTIRRNRLF